MIRSAAAPDSEDVPLYRLLSAEEAQLMRDKHHELVEQWLDQASFAAELFKLHAKYGIETGEPGYADYLKYLREKYYANLRNVGPVVDPLEEDCQCLFCQFDEDAALATEAEPATNKSEANRTDQADDHSPKHDGWHRSERENEKKPGRDPAADYDHDGSKDDGGKDHSNGDKDDNVATGARSEPYAVGEYDGVIMPPTPLPESEWLDLLPDRYFDDFPANTSHFQRPARSRHDPSDPFDPHWSKKQKHLMGSIVPIRIADFQPERGPPATSAIT